MADKISQIYLLKITEVMNYVVYKTSKKTKNHKHMKYGRQVIQREKWTNTIPWQKGEINSQWDICAVNIGVHVYFSTLVSSGYYDPVVGLLGHVVVLFLVFREPP